jgi:hypothetical protein
MFGTPTESLASGTHRLPAKRSIVALLESIGPRTSMVTPPLA